MGFYFKLLYPDFFLLLLTSYPIGQALKCNIKWKSASVKLLSSYCGLSIFVGEGKKTTWNSFQQEYSKALYYSGNI